MATDPARITTPERTAEDVDQALRPKSLDEFIGQQSARENLRVFVHAAKSRGEALDHVLLHGPPGPRQDHAGRQSSRARWASASARPRAR